MAYVGPTKNGGMGVFHSVTGELLHEYTGMDAREKAQSKMRELHKANNPKPSNRGVKAARRHAKKGKK